MFHILYRQSHKIIVPKAGTLLAMNQAMPLTFTVPNCFDLRLCISAGQVFRWQSTRTGFTGISGSRLFQVRDLQATYDVQALPSEHSETAFRDLFRLETDLPTVHTAVIQADPRWEPWIRELSGLRLMRWEYPEECLFSFLCTPANNIPRITRMIQRLCDTYGEPLFAFDSGIHRSFPQVSTLANLSEDALCPLGFGYRSRSLIQAARALQERGPGWMGSLRTAGYWDAKRELVRLPGVGAKIADCVLLLGLDYWEAVPVDTHMWQAMQLLLPELQGKSLTEKTYRQILDWFHDRFGVWTRWAQQYLFTARLKKL